MLSHPTSDCCDLNCTNRDPAYVESRARVNNSTRRGVWPIAVRVVVLATAQPPKLVVGGIFCGTM